MYDILQTAFDIELLDKHDGVLLLQHVDVCDGGDVRVDEQRENAAHDLLHVLGGRKDTIFAARLHGHQLVVFARRAHNKPKLLNLSPVRKSD
jgi:hypothetical protein